jgi:hypothetical protein
MQDQSARARLDSLGLIDEQLYAAYRRAQRSTRDDEQKDIADEIRSMERARSALLKDLLSAPSRH